MIHIIEIFKNLWSKIDLPYDQQLAQVQHFLVPLFQQLYQHDPQSYLNISLNNQNSKQILI